MAPVRWLLTSNRGQWTVGTVPKIDFNLKRGHHTVSTTTALREPKRTEFEQTVLLLQGGGALGSYQAGVYQALAEADLYPDWVAGISIGAVNAALIAGNSPERRVKKLREFWEAVSTPPLGVPHLSSINITN